RGIEYINNYEYDSGKKEIGKVVESGTAAQALKEKSYLWLAFIELMGEDDKLAENIIRKMFADGIGVDIDQSTLPEELFQSNQLMKLYNTEKKKYIKIRTDIAAKKDKYINEAEKCYKKGELDKAEESLDEILLADPENKEVQELKNRISEDRKKVSEHMSMAEEQFTSGNMEGARENIDMVLEVTPNNKEAANFAKKIEKQEAENVKVREQTSKYMAKAEKYYKKGKLKEAKAQLDVILLADPGNEEAKSLSERIKIESEPEEVETEKVDAEGLYKKIVTNINNYEMEMAIKDLKELLELENVSKEIVIPSYFWMAFIHLFDGNEKMAYRTMKSMMNKGIGIEYDLENLPAELSQNIQLISIYNEVKERFPIKEIKSKKIAAILLEKAKKMYIKRMLDETDAILDEILEIDEGNKEATKFKEKVQDIKEIRVETHRKLVETVYESALSYYNNNNMIGAVQEAYKVLKYNPKHQRAYAMYKDAYERLQDIVKTANEKDKKAFREAVQCYLEGKYDKAATMFRNMKLQNSKIDILLGQSVTNLSLVDNQKSADKYFKKAIESREKRRYVTAREYLLSALMLNKYNLEARILLEEVNYELKK
ncbi:tetratricopeptide repeat protein, partial [Elusimicrobiota bacterium]